ncbi:diacylglycerol kinase (ATP) [Gemmobacter caeni]|jgi:diacylglycerol kinase (ATP)|uniref:Diacylglycerol kinase n=1 Tax=Gemmobacter caeni TaxID=589035 RepID=A0A2T6BBG8_9RHOB|nr:diacylglycerol kinase [Gemmobacter caeni]PTX53415.1 diacylglycerol kinase [Gemmobacter caeni]TWJ05526.1 diacylglycerol kinase (ATP) [Gemmobacter caeni]
MIARLLAELARLRNTATWSWEGWAASWRNEKSLRQWFAVNIASAALAFTLDLTPGERALILALGVLLLAAELMNTAVEEVVDYISTDHDPRAKRAKDAASAAVAVTAIAGGLAWLMILLG